MKQKNIYNISITNSFFDGLVDGVINRFGFDPFILSEMLILLPNRRSCLSLGDMFLKKLGDDATFLPSIKAIGDIDDVEILKAGGRLNLPVEISVHKRRLLLTNIIIEWHKATNRKINTEQASYLAYELSSFLDETQRQNLSFSELENIVPEELSHHWQLTLDFFDNLTKKYPEKLAELGLIDPIERRNLLIKEQAKLWRNSPPDYPIIAAGSTSSAYATSALFETILSLENGYVILPALDQYIDDESWLSLTEEKNEDSHPQFGLKHFLEQSKISRFDVKDWVDDFVREDFEEREVFISELMRPSMTIDKWREYKVSKEAVANIKFFEAENIREEASLIAVIIRDFLEKQPDKNIAVVSDDNSLPPRITAILERWGVETDSSSGKEISSSNLVVFLKLIIDVIRSDCSPLPLLSLLKHPYCSCGMSPYEFNKIIRDLERNILRGVRINNGINGIIDIVNNLSEVKGKKFDESNIKLLEKINEYISPLSDILNSDKYDLQNILRAHLKLAELLAESDEKTGEERIWGSKTGEKISSFFADLIASSESFILDSPKKSYKGLFETLITGEIYYPEKEYSSNVKLLSPMEARLQSFDLVILAGLNNGVWPSEKSNIWMSRSMRREFGLPSLRRDVGKSAHDFCGLFSSEKVILTRSKKVGGKPSIISPWLQRIVTLLDASNLQNELDLEKYWRKWAHLIDEPEKYERISYPAPTPPSEARPKELYVTSIEKLMRNPYSLYAAKILKLKKLDDIDREPNAADFGNVIHDILEQYAENYQNGSFEEEYQRICEIGFNKFDELKNRPSVYSLWWNRFENIAQWFVNIEAIRRKNISDIYLEKTGEISLSCGSTEFKLKAKADRIEVLKNGEVSIVDYKTGGYPSDKDVSLGISPQLILEALIISKGGFMEVGSKKSADISYWKVTGRAANNNEKIVFSGEKLEKIVHDSYEGIKSVFEIFSNPETPYLATPYSKREEKYNDYEHLSRNSEWSCF